MNPSNRSSRVLGTVVAVLALVAGTSATIAPAWAAPNPTITALDPQVAPTAGGTPVRIYGMGFAGATSVTFGAVVATDFAVIDGKLITAIVPPAAGGAGDNNTFVDVTVTTPVGSNTMTDGMYYTDATITVTPSTGLHPGDPITVVVTGYKPNASVAIPEIQPLLYYLEGGPAFPPGPPPYVQILNFTSTDASGNLTLATNLADPFTGTNGQAYDPNIVCPPNQKTTNRLGTSPSASLYEPSFSARCRIEIAQFGTASLGTPISFAGAPTPAPPVLNIDQSSANQGDTVNIAAGSVRWNANPFYGSSKNALKPGQTTTVLQICGIGGDPNACSATEGHAAVELTRYRTDSTTTPIVGEFSGATASGAIKVGMDLAPGDYDVRLRQRRPGSGSIAATAPLHVN